jgi:hypothetical protein
LTDTRLWELNGRKPLNPASLLEDATEYGWPTPWSGLVNGISCPRGKHPGHAHFLVSNATLAALPKSGPIEIKCTHEFGTTTWQKYYLVESQAITKQVTPAHWITLADRRHLFQRVATGTKRYNVRKNKTEYVAGTGGYTWQTVLNNLWGLLPSAGTAPTLQSAPSSTPENLLFDGLKVWDCINQVLTAIGHILAYDPIADTFAFVQASASQAGLASKQTTYKNRVLWDYKPSELPANNRPAKALVTFHILPTEENDSAPAFRATPHVQEPTIPSGIPGTSYPIIDTMFFWTGRESTITSRGTEIGNAIDGLMGCYKEPWGKVYAGCLGFTPGSQVSEVIWISNGQDGFCTHVKHTDIEIDWPAMDFEVGGGGRQIQGTLTGLADGTGQYTGKKVATIDIEVAPCGSGDLIGESVEVVDHSGCIFDLTAEELDGVWVWASEGVAQSTDPEASPGDLTDCHWVADDRCCVEADG